MADIVKKVNPGVPVNERSQRFDQSDAVEGDVLMILDSLGKPATRLIIEAGDPLAFRMNVYQTMYPHRTLLEDGYNQFEPDLLNLTSGIQYKDDTGATIWLGSNETFELDDDLPVSDIELVTVSGLFEVIAV